MGWTEKGRHRPTQGQCEGTREVTCLLDVLIFQNFHVLRQQLARKADVHCSLYKSSQVARASAHPTPTPRGPAHHGTPCSLLPPPQPHSLLASCSDWSRLAVCHYRDGQSEVALGLKQLGLESLKGLGTAQGTREGGIKARILRQAHHTLSKHENVKFI